MIDVSVVVPVHNGEATIGDCLSGLEHQTLGRDRYEVIVVDDGSVDATAVRAAGHSICRVIRQAQKGAAAARNAGAASAAAPWVAFLDADMVPSRGWLGALLDRLERAGRSGSAPVGAAGHTVGLRSTSAAARFCDLTGSLDASRHLAHPRYPFAPSGNVVYRLEAFSRVGGFDPRYSSYEACDLHARLGRTEPGPFLYEPRAVAFHRHRAGWRAYWRQQLTYGRGYAQFFLHHRVPWSAAAEAKAWLALVPQAVQAARPGDDEHALLRRGTFVKQAANRMGFTAGYWSPRERRRW